MSEAVKRGNYSIKSKGSKDQEKESPKYLKTFEEVNKKTLCQFSVLWRGLEKFLRKLNLLVELGSSFLEWGCTRE